jgi:hypothetical protein
VELQRDSNVILKPPFKLSIICKGLNLTKLPGILPPHTIALDVSNNQGGIIQVNLASKLTRNLKTSQEIFVGTPTKISLEQTYKQIPLTRNGT